MRNWMRRELGEVALKLSPDPHLEWLFRHRGASAGGVPVAIVESPKMVPPRVVSSGFATRAGPDGPPKPSAAGTVSGGRRREMRAIEIGDRSRQLDEIRFYLVNFQVWFLTEHVKRNEETDKLAGMRLCSNEWRVEIERRAGFNDVQVRIEEQRGLLTIAVFGERGPMGLRRASISTTRVVSRVVQHGTLALYLVDQYGISHIERPCVPCG